jgi:PAS domain S-box-containing protein
MLVWSAAGRLIYASYSRIRSESSEVNPMEDLRAISILPVKCREKVTAVLNMASHTIDEIPIGIRSTLEAIAAQVGEAIEKLKAEEDRKQAEEDLLASKEYLNKIINTIGDPIFVKDWQHRLILVNDAECSLIGHSREEILGKTDYDFFPKEQVDVFWEKDEEVFRTGKENVNEEQITDAEGITRTIITKKTLYIDGR